MLYNKSLQVICFICGHVYMFNTLMVSNIVFSDFYTAFFESQLFVATDIIFTALLKYSYRAFGNSVW